MKNIKIKENIIISKWLDDLQSKSFRIETLVTAILFILVMSSASNVINFVEGRRGVILPDPVLALTMPVDLTYLIFITLYLSAVIAVAFLIKHPKDFIYAAQAYSFIIFFRVLCMYLTPLDAPPLLIPLQDPLILKLTTNGIPWTRDLFFSGHTSSMFILFLTANNKYLRIIFLAGTFIVGGCLLLQHVHYTIDVLAAPFFAYGSYRIVRLLHNRIGK